MSIVLQGSTSGSITLQEPAVAGSTIINLPATSGTALVAPTALTVPNTTGTVMVSGNMPSFSAYRSGTQSVSSGSFTKVQFNAEEWDTASCYDSSTNYRFTPNVAGYYQVNGSVSWGFTGNLAVCSIYKNGSSAKWGTLQPATGSGCSGIVSALIYLNGTTDYIELYVYQNNGTNNISSSQSETYFQAFLARTA